MTYELRSWVITRQFNAKARRGRDAKGNFLPAPALLSMKFRAQLCMSYDSLRKVGTREGNIVSREDFIRFPDVELQPAIGRVMHHQPPPEHVLSQYRRYVVAGAGLSHMKLQPRHYGESRSP